LAKLDVDVFDTIANRFHETQDQLKADVRFYCDNDEEGPGKRWTIVPDDPDDPEDIKNSKLKRFWEKTDDKKNPPPVQQWEDKTNWVRMSSGSSGAKQTTGKDHCLGELQHRKIDVDGETPVGINPDRVTLTVSKFYGKNTITRNLA
jgi:hypothetical protein